MDKKQLEMLASIATQLDEEGNEKMAASLDTVLMKVAAEEEKKDKEEKAPKGLTGNQKKAIRAFKAAAARVDKAFYNGIPKAVKKLDDLAEQVLECCEGLELD